MILIQGPSGTGKTALAATLQPQVLQRKGLYIAGKFDLYLRHEPYAGVASACRALCRDLSSIQEICQEIVQQLGQELMLLVQILPELKTIVGRTTHVDPQEEDTMGPQGLQEAKKRIAHAFRRFFRVICSFVPCLVLSLDDLQVCTV